MIKIKTFVRAFITLSKRVYLFLLDCLLLPAYVFLNLFKSGKFYENNIVFVTAAEKNYFNELISLITSFKENCKNRIIIYDLGLEPEQRTNLFEKFPDAEVRNFEFENYPNFIKIYTGNKLGNYAWKPIIVDNLLNELKCKIVWLDAGNMINRKIIFLKVAITARNLIVPTSSNKIKDWTHPRTLEYINLNDKYLSSNNYASGLIGFDYKSKKARLVSKEWKRFSLIQECISPSGSNRSNHRQDQAVLTLLLYKYIFKNIFIRSTYIKTNFICGILFHKKKMFDI